MFLLSQCPLGNPLARLHEPPCTGTVRKARGGWGYLCVHPCRSTCSHKMLIGPESPPSVSDTPDEGWDGGFFASTCISFS